MGDNLDQHRSSVPDIYFRAFDRLQIDTYISALQKECKSLVLISLHQELLDYYGEVVVKRLNQEFPKTSVEVFLPSDTNGLLDKFNAILNNLSFELATKASVQNAPDKVWLIQNANALGIKELELLLRLIENFPGAGICALVLYQSTPDTSPTLFENNARVSTWPLLMPTAEQKLNAVQQARRNGTEEIALEFFNHLAKAEKKFLAATSEALPDVKPEVKAAPLNVPPSNKFQKSASAQKQKKTRWLWPIVMCALLLMSAGMMALFNPEFGNQLASMFAPKSKPLRVLPSEEIANKPTDPQTTSSKPEIPEIAKQGLRWLKTLPADHFVLEYKTFASAEEAQNEIQGKEWLKRTYIVPVTSEGSTEVKFLIFDGPFRTSEMARKAASRMPNSSEIAIESVEGLRGYAAPQTSKP
jgi:hypothetical protein